MKNTPTLPPTWTPLHLLLLLHYFVVAEPIKHLTMPEIRGYTEDLVKHGLILADDHIECGYRATPQGEAFIALLQSVLMSEE